jgi:ABC-2 type transport system permease protein
MIINHSFYCSTLATYRKNRECNKYSFPKTLFFQRISSTIYGLILPIIIYKYVFNNQLSDSFSSVSKTTDYITFIALGNAAFIMCFSTLISVGRALIMEYRQKTLKSIVHTPVNFFGYMMGVYLEQLIRSSGEFLLILLVGKMCGASYNIDSLSTFPVFLFFFSLTSLSIASVVSIIMIVTLDTYVTQNTVVTVLFLFSGTLIPIEMFPKPIAYLSHLFPLTDFLNCFREVVISGKSLTSVLDAFMFAIVLSVVYLGISVFTTPRLLKRVCRRI